MRGPLGAWFAGTGERLRREVAGLLMVGFALFGYTSLVGDGTGAVGRVLRLVLSALFGGGRYVVPGLVGIAGMAVLAGKPLAGDRRRWWGTLLGLMVLATFLHRGIPGETALTQGMAGAGGGLLGGIFSWALLHTVGPTGRTIVVIIGALVSLVLVTGLSVAAAGRGLVQGGGPVLRRGWARMGDFLFETVEEEDSADDHGDEPEAAAAGDEPHDEPEGDDPYWEDPRAALSGPRVILHHDTEANGALGANGMPGAGGETGEGAVAGAAAATGAAGAGAAGAAGAVAAPHRPYQRPPLTLLRSGRGAARRASKGAGHQAQALEETLASFGVTAKVIGVQQGPAVTRYELQLARGIKVSRVQNLANDIALSLAATDVRIEAPIPGKSAVGIEVPNREIRAVPLRDVLEAPEFQEMKSPLAFAVGQDIAGQPVVTHLDGLLHLLIAGATGSGKSVCINALLASLLCKAGPDEVRLLLIDPKMVELSGYNGIPHLLVPVITDPRRAASALQWLVREMERRYESFAEAGTRDIVTYNKRRVQLGEDKLPYIVVVIDELADLMLVAPVDVEDAIQRLAQMARAAGIHLVVATQRPSVDVITGVIKANIPSRIAFAVASQTDSRVILDMAGADKLVGKGDMLFFPIGASKPVRVQGCYISEQELGRLLDFVRKQAEPQYDEDVLAAAEQAGPDPGEDYDELFPEAVRLVVEAGHASVSHLQRRLRIGYTRAGRLVDMMEERGFVGPHMGSKARELRITMEDYRRLFGGKEKGGEDDN